MPATRAMVLVLRLRLQTVPSNSQAPAKKHAFSSILHTDNMNKAPVQTDPAVQHTVFMLKIGPMTAWNSCQHEMRACWQPLATLLQPYCRKVHVVCKGTIAHSTAEGWKDKTGSKAFKSLDVARAAHHLSALL